MNNFIKTDNLQQVGAFIGMLANLPQGDPPSSAHIAVIRPTVKGVGITLSYKNGILYHAQIENNWGDIADKLQDVGCIASDIGTFDGLGGCVVVEGVLHLTEDSRGKIDGRYPPPTEGIAKKREAHGYRHTIFGSLLEVGCNSTGGYGDKVRMVLGLVELVVTEARRSEGGTMAEVNRELHLVTRGRPFNVIPYRLLNHPSDLVPSIEGLQQGPLPTREVEIVANLYYQRELLGANEMSPSPNWIRGYYGDMPRKRTRPSFREGYGGCTC